MNMTETINMSRIDDPKDFPVVFLPDDESGIRFAPIWAPLSFSLSRSPRTAVFKGFAARQSDLFLVDRDINDGSSVVQVPSGVQRTVNLYADRRDYANANVVLRVEETSGGWRSTGDGEVVHVRQPMFAADISYVFEMASATYGFDQVEFESALYWPALYMAVSFMSHLDDQSMAWPVLSMPVKAPATARIVAPGGSHGVLDMLCEVGTMWFDDRERNVPSAVVPTGSRSWVFGVRLFVSKPQAFALSVETSLGTAASVDGVYPSSVARSFGDGLVSAWCWAGAAGELFHVEHSGIEVSDGGYPMQGGVPVASYLIENMLPDIEFSSSSSSSTSSTTMERSTSSQTMSTSRSTISTSSTSSASTGSSSTRSTSSQSSSQGSSISTVSTSSSSSTWVKESVSSESSSSVIESHSSPSSSSTMLSLTSTSVASHVVLRMDLDNGPDDTGWIDDLSGYGNRFRMASVSPGMGPPTWLPSGGAHQDGSLSFSADAWNSDYVVCKTMEGMSRMDAGTISMWLKQSPGNQPGVVFALTNGFVASKYEFAIKIDPTPGACRAEAWLMVRNQLSWNIRSPVGSIPPGEWIYLSLVHDGTAPRMFISGSEVVCETVGASADRWFSSLFYSSSPPEMMICGGTARAYPPYVAQGFSGELDEITIWDSALDENDLLADR